MKVYLATFTVNGENYISLTQDEVTEDVMMACIDKHEYIMNSFESMYTNPLSRENLKALNPIILSVDHEDSGAIYDTITAGPFLMKGDVGSALTIDGLFAKVSEEILQYTYLNVYEELEKNNS